MKNQLLKLIKMASKGLFYGVMLQCFLFSFLKAEEGNAQGANLDDSYIQVERSQFTVQELLEEVENSTDFHFVYTRDLVDNENFTLDKSGKLSVYDVLIEISKKKSLKFKQVNNTIYLGLKNNQIEKAIKNSNLKIQTRNITGKVTSIEETEGLPGVNVVEKGTNNGTVTNINGEYSLEVSAGATLVFSSVGYVSQEVSIGNRSVIDISLTEDVQQLEELVVVGYGTSKIGDITGSISTLKKEDIETGNVNNVEQQMNGRFAGVNVVASSGEPGSGAAIRIRGTNSILGNTQPLFVIDGIPQGTSISNNINPNDIESIQVLKDASATAIYGSRGANGVILITTKEGRGAKPTVRFNSYVGMNQLDKKIDLLNAEELAQLHQMAIDQGYLQQYDPNSVNGPGTDWQDEVFRDAATHNHQLSVSGSSDNIQYRFSGNYLSEDGIILNTDFERYSFRSFIESEITDKFTLGGNIYFAKTQRNRDGGAMNQVLTATPLYDIKDENGEYNIYVDPTNRLANPVASAKLKIRENNDYSTQLNIFGSYDITESLRADLRFGTVSTQSKNNSFAPINTAEGFNNDIASGVTTISRFNWISNNTLTYSKSFNQDHILSAMVGFIAESYSTENAGANANGYITDNQEYHSLQSATVQSTNSSLFENQLASFISRVNYNFKDKYLFTFNARYDGSSNFGKENKWAFFPSGALGWKLSNEPFMQNVDFINNLKLRASYGATGEQGIASYQTLPSLSSVGSLFADNTVVIGFYPSDLGNPNLRWEVTRQANLGIDAGLWGGKLNLNFDVYYKKTTDLLYRVALPTTTGFSSVFDNVGSMENKGIELSVNSQNTTGEFDWNTNFNFSLNRNKILDLGNRVDGSNIELIPSPAGGVGRPEGGSTVSPSGLIEGEPIGGVYGWVFDGTYKSVEEVSSGPEPDKVPGDAKYRDLNDDGMIDGDDRRIISNPIPDFIGGLTNNFSYKGFSLNVFLQFKVGHELFSNNHFSWSNFTGIRNTQSWALDAWSPSNPDSNIPRANFNYRDNGISSFHVFDASFLRAQNITLGYNLPVDRMAWNIQSFRVYFSVDNAFTLTSYPEYNPDVSATGNNAITRAIDDAIYPLSKSFILGVDVQF